MNRFAQVIADECTSKLAGHIKNSNPILSDKLTFNSSLKYLALNDPAISIEINDKNAFRLFELRHEIIVPTSAALSSARVSDFLLGATRVKNQYETLIKMKDAGANSAWLLVSAYYCAFYACIEISKLFNRISFSLDPEDVETIKSKSTGPEHAAFFAAGHTNFVGCEQTGTLIFKTVGSKPHVAAWENGSFSLRTIFSTKDWIEVNNCLTILKDPDLSPSKIRNVWNYKRSDYYGYNGDKQAIAFKKLVGNPEGSFKWLKGKTSQIAALDPCIIPVLCEPLAAAVIDTAQRVRTLLKQTATQQVSWN